MKKNDYYGHYKAIVKELSGKQVQTLKIYRRENGVCVNLPTGISISFEEYRVSVLSRLIAVHAGKEVTDVIAL